MTSSKTVEIVSTDGSGAVFATVELIENDRDPSVGAVTWPCATYLLQYLAEDPDGVVRAMQERKQSSCKPIVAGDGGAIDDDRRLTVLELGSGTGVVGIGIAALGFCRRVTVTDRAHELELLSRNVELNRRRHEQPEPDAFRHGNSRFTELLVKELDWKAGYDDDKDIASDLMVACECMYAVDNLTKSHFAATLASLLHRRGRRHGGERDAEAFADALPSEALVAFEQRDRDIEDAVREQLVRLDCTVRRLRKSRPVNPSEGNAMPSPVHYEVWHVKPAPRSQRLLAR